MTVSLCNKLNITREKLVKFDFVHFLEAETGKSEQSVLLVGLEGGNCASWKSVPKISRLGDGVTQGFS